MATFYRDFASCYGTFFLLVFVYALVTRQHVETGTFGAVGVPLISLGYAAYRRPGRLSEERHVEDLKVRIIALEAERPADR